MAQAKIQKGGTGAAQTAAGRLESQPNNCISNSIKPCANCSTGAESGAGSTLPIRAIGVTMKLSTGMAIALAIGLTMEMSPNNKTVSGTKPTHRDNCVRPSVLHQARKRRRRLPGS